MKIGFIGLGRMGSAMATNLIKGGHQVSVFNRSIDKARPLVELGARQARGIADACQAEVVMTMLADDQAVTDIAFATDGIVANLPRGATRIQGHPPHVGSSQHAPCTDAGRQPGA